MWSACPGVAPVWFCSHSVNPKASRNSFQNIVVLILKCMQLMKPFRIITYTQGYFCDGMRCNTIPALSQKDAIGNGIQELFFLGSV
jgi:hypothetical protein